MLCSRGRGFAPLLTTASGQLGGLRTSDHAVQPKQSCIGFVVGFSPSRRKTMRCIAMKRPLAICIILIGGSTVWADKAAKPLAIDDVFNLRLAVDPQISPDGKRVVYVRQFNDIMTDQ